MPSSDVIIVGAGQAGLAMSQCLSQHNISHVILERGRIAERWRSQRWDSLRLLTPAWMTRLPGRRPPPVDPDRFMTRHEVIDMFSGYAGLISAPVIEQVRVSEVTRCGDGFSVATDTGQWQARALVIATGACDRPAVPAWAGDLPGRILQLPAPSYRNPDQLPRGGVLIVGASATGVQLAREITASGRAVTLAVGRHTAMPRRYRGRDIMYWMDRSGILDESWRSVPDLAAARHQPSLQLSGQTDRGEPDLARLAAEGARLVGRALGMDGNRLLLRPDLPLQVQASQRRRQRVLARIDGHIERQGIAAPPDPRAWAPRAVRDGGETALDLVAEGIETVLWATGFRRSYDWLRLPVLDRDGEISHCGGVTPVPGLYALGLPFLRRRSSTFIDGVGRDAVILARQVAAHLSAGPAASRAA